MQRKVRIIAWRGALGRRECNVTDNSCHQPRAQHKVYLLAAPIERNLNHESKALLAFPQWSFSGDCRRRLTQVLPPGSCYLRQSQRIRLLPTRNHRLGGQRWAAIPKGPPPRHLVMQKSRIIIAATHCAYASSPIRRTWCLLKTYREDRLEAAAIQKQTAPLSHEG